MVRTPTCSPAGSMRRGKTFSKWQSISGGEEMVYRALSIGREGKRFETSPTLQPIAGGEPSEPRVLFWAGGDGVRLRPLVRELIGDDRPKQFAAIVGEESLLAQTRRRAALFVSPEDTQIVLTRHHAAYHREVLTDAPASSVLIQPENRGTATAVLYGLLRVARQRPRGPIVV